MESNRQAQLIKAVVANSKGEIFDLEGYAAVGRAGDKLQALQKDISVKIPHGGELMYLPDRYPVLYNLYTEKIECVLENPYVSNERLFPVAVFNSPGYVNLFTCAYQEDKEPEVEGKHWEGK